MLSRINGFIVACSQSWWKILLLFVGQSAAFQGLNFVTTRFPDMTAGDIPFDMQNDLRPDEIFTQLAGYSEQAFDYYYAFEAIDFFFPVFGGLFLGSLCAFGLRHTSRRWYDVAVARNLFVLLLVAPAFDYLENLNLLWAVTAWPEQVPAAANLAVAAKQGKLLFLNVSFGVTGLLLLTAFGRWLGRRSGLIGAGDTTSRDAPGDGRD